MQTRQITKYKPGVNLSRTRTKPLIDRGSLISRASQRSSAKRPTHLHPPWRPDREIVDQNPPKYQRKANTTRDSSPLPGRLSFIQGYDMTPQQRSGRKHARMATGAHTLRPASYTHSRTLCRQRPQRSMIKSSEPAEKL
jgi:hypothetical protein